MSLLRQIVVVSRDAELQQLARQVGTKIFVADDLAEAIDIVEMVQPDLIFFDDNYTPDNIRQFIDATDKNSIKTPIIVIGRGQKYAGTAADFIRAGAYDYLHRDQNHNQLEQIAARIGNTTSAACTGVTTKDTSLPRAQSRGPKTQELPPNLSAAGVPGLAYKGEFFVDDCAASVSMVGRSRAFVKTLGMIRLVAASNCNPVLIIGETGTGKELAAKAIHTLRHPNENFVAINCAALTTNLLESELFGHVKGSFTGADCEKTGLLELAGAGTILLDEISEMPLDLQAKLLRVLQERTFRKVGGIKNITCNATIMACTNRNLYTEMKNHRFRRDLYYRLNICPVHIVPLRSPDRRDDIRLLTEYFLRTSTICPKKQQKATCLTSLAMEALEKHDWPGNIRELRNVIDRALLLETTEKIGLNNIILDPPEFEVHPENHYTLAQFTSGQNAHNSIRDQVESEPVSHIKEFSLAKAERELIARALQETGWQKTQAATLLGITRATLYAKVKQYNIKKDTFNLSSPSRAGSREPDPTEGWLKAQEPTLTEDLAALAETGQDKVYKDVPSIPSHQPTMV